MKNGAVPEIRIADPAPRLPAHVGRTGGRSIDLRRPLTGTVADSTGAVVPGATITITRIGTEVLTATSDPAEGTSC